VGVLLLERWLVLKIAIKPALTAAGDNEGGLRLTRGMIEGVAWQEWVVKNEGMVEWLNI
jgi:hypothetical protein